MSAHAASSVRADQGLSLTLLAVALPTRRDVPATFARGRLSGTYLVDERCANAPAETPPSRVVRRLCDMLRPDTARTLLSGGDASGHRALKLPHQPRAGGPQTVTAERPTPDSGEPPSAFCPRCLPASDQAAVGALVGLCHCSECSATRAAGAGTRRAATARRAASTSPPRSLAVAPRRILALPAISLGRPGLRPSLAAAILVVAISLLALTLGGGFRPAGGVNGAMDSRRRARPPTPDRRGACIAPSVVTPTATTVAVAANPTAPQGRSGDRPTDHAERHPEARASRHARTEEDDPTDRT